MRRTWRKILSTALSLVMCGGMVVPALAGTAVSAAEPVKIACIGDSITAGFAATNSTFYYPTQLQKLLGSDYEVKNFGVSGHTLLGSGDQPYVHHANYQASQTYNPDYVIIMLGTNDAKPQNWTHKDEFEADMKAMIETYQALSSKPTVIIATSPTVGTTNIGISEAVVTGEVVPIQKQVAADMGCPVIDINALTKHMPHNYADGIHPNDTGYAAMAEMFYAGLQDIFTASIKGFAVNGGSAVIDDEAATIALTLPRGSDVTAIEPDITLADGAKLDKTGPQDFTHPVSYTVTSPDGKAAKTYTVTVKAQATIKVACVGDSITAVSVDSDGARHSYIPYLQEALGEGYEVSNFGNSGKTLLQDSANGNGYTLTTTYQQSLAYNPDIVTIMLGTNDSKAENWNRLSDQYEDELRALVQVYQELPSHPTVYIATSPTAHSTAHGIQQAILHEEIAPIQRRVAADMGCPLIEVHDATQDAADKFWDGIHPTEDGCVLLGGVFSEAIQDTVTTMNGFTIDNGANRVETAGVMDNDANTITVTLPAATDVTALEPALSLPDGASYAPVGPQDFTTPVTYTVTAADGSTTRDYTVTVNVLSTVKVACVGDSMTAATTYPDALEGFLGDGYQIGRFGQNSTTVQKDGLKENGANPNSAAYTNQSIYQKSKDFAPNIVLLMLGANDSKQGEGQTQNGHALVTNWKENSPENYEQDLKELVASYQALPTHPIVILATSPSGYATAGNWAAKPEIVNAQIAPIQRKVAADMGCFLVDFNAMTQGKETSLISGDGLHPSFNGYYLLAGEYYAAIQDAQAAVYGFAIGDDAGIVSQIDKTIYVTVPDGTDLTALTPDITLADGALSDKTGSQNFGRPVPYTVTSAGGWTSAYTVSVTSPSGVSVAKIELLTLPDKTTYLVGEKLDTTGATLNVVYTDGTRDTIPVTESMVSGYDWLTASKQTLTVAYEGKDTTFTVQVNPYGLLGTFSAMSGKFTVLQNNSNLMYADWKWADQYPIDLSGYGDRSTLRLELDVTFASENPAVDPSQMWQWLTIKLRSTDVKDKEGDPDLKVNGGNNDTNSEHNYGWDLKASEFEDTQALHLSIPLNQACTNHRGLMDWSEVGRIIITCPLYGQYTTNSIQHSMTISNVRIVDVSQNPAAPDTATLQAAVDKAAAVDVSGYTPASVEAFQNALAWAQAYLTNPYALQADVDQAAADLTAAQEALVLKPSYTLGDVDNSGEITAADALLALQAATGKISLGDAQLLAANVDGQDGVTANDALLILQYATQKITSFPAQADPDTDPDGVWAVESTSGSEW